MTITNADLDQLDALAEAATPGPWHYDDGITDDLADPPERGKPPLVEDGRAYWIASTDGMVGEDGFTQEEADANGRLVAAARLAIPALVAEVRRLRGVVPGVAIGARLRDLTVAQLDALPVGARLEDANDDAPAVWTFTRSADGTWSAPESTAYTPADLLGGWLLNPDYDYRLAHLPTEETTR